MDEIIFEMDAWQPRIVRRKDNFYLNLPIESGFVSFSRDVEISCVDIEILRGDEERCVLCWAALYRTGQVGEISGGVARDVLDHVLHADPATTIQFLARQNARERGVIANIVRLNPVRGHLRFPRNQWSS